jgi:predicted metal-binding membrane protein
MTLRRERGLQREKEVGYRLVSALVIRNRTAAAALVGLAVVAWVLVADQMSGMDEGPGTDLGGARWFLGIWVLMTAAMMLPTTVRVAPTALFAAGYLAVWTVYGLLAYVVFQAWDDRGTVAAGVLVVAAGIYELTPFKQAALRRCRHPHESADPLRTGLDHGVDCVVCSGALMVVLFALGVMSLVWMVVVAAAIFAEKVLPLGQRLSRVVAVTLVILGIWVAVSPSSVPGLTDPSQPPSMEMNR